MMFLSIVDFFAVKKNRRETYIGIFLPVAGLIFDEKYFMDIYGKCYNKCMGFYYCYNEIECTDRIFHETGTYRAVVVSGKAGECFFSL